MILTPSYRRAFSMIELVIVVVIIGIIAAIAIPRMSRGVSGASNSALKANLATLRNALDLYQAEHGGQYPPIVDFKDALTMYSDAAGSDFGASKTTTLLFGPYLREIPKAPVGPNKGNDEVTSNTSDTGKAWIYTQSTGVIKLNVPGTELDDEGKKYQDY